MNLSNKQMEGLLKMASKKLGTDPESLKRQIESGNINDAVKNLGGDNSSKLNQVLSDPEKAKEMLNSPQAKQILQMFKLKN